MITNNRVPVFLTIVLAFILGLSTTTTAQVTNAKGEAVVTLGSIDEKAATTMEAVLAAPRLTASPGFVVTGYKVSILAADKTESTGQAYFGPYEVNGAKLTEQVKTIMKKYAKAKARVFFEDIKVMGGGGVIAGSPVILSCKAQ